MIGGGVSCAAGERAITDDDETIRLFGGVRTKGP